MTDRKKPGVAFWATVGLIVALVAYALSFVPALWIECHVVPSTPKWFWLYDAVGALYLPIDLLASHSDGITEAIRTYRRSLI